MTPSDDPGMVLQEPYAPVIDGIILYEQPFYHLSSGTVRPYTPIVFGMQLDEGTMFTPSGVICFLQYVEIYNIVNL